MRSRYTAFALGTPEALDYLVATHHPDFRDPGLRADIESSSRDVDAWESLRVVRSGEDQGGSFVEFVATYRRGASSFELRERSRFVRESGRWFYTAGELE